MSQNGQRAILHLRVAQDNEKKEDAADQFLWQIAEILKGRKLTLSCEILINGKFLWFFITCPSGIKEHIKGQWYSQYPGAEIQEIKDYTQKLFNPAAARSIVGCEMHYKYTDFIPVKTYSEIDKNPLTSLAGIASSFMAEDVGVIQITLEPPPYDTLWNKFLKSRRESARRKNQGSDGNLSEASALEEDKESKPYFRATIRFVGAAKSMHKASLNLSSITAIYKKSLERPNMQRLEEGKLRNDQEFIAAFRARILSQSLLKRYRFRLSSSEAATIFHLPYKKEQISQVVQIRSKRAPAPQNLPTADLNDDQNIAIFGQTNFQSEKKKFGIKTGDRRRHLYIVGKSGMGKSKLLELLISQDLKAGKGIILLDPHGDLSYEVLNLVPEERHKDVVYFDPSDIDYPIGFNPMEGAGSFEFKQNVVFGFISIFKKLFGANWNERFEHVLRYTTLALLEYPHASILGIPRMLSDNIFRQDVISHITDPLVKKFWATEFSSWNDQYASEAVVPIINKIGQFIANPLIRNIVGQTKTGFSLDEVMNKEKILIANLAIGKLGEENSALLGSMLVTKIWQTAIARASMPEDERKDTFLYVDEFQNFATATFANIFSEARKYRLNLTVANQYTEQLSSEIRSTVFGNVGNIVSFRVGGEDAPTLAKEFDPVFNINDFLNLDVRNFFIKMSIDGQTAQPFSAVTLTLDKPSQDNLKKIIELARTKFAKPKKEVEEELQKLELGKIETKKPALPSEKEPEIEKPQVVEEPFFPEPII